MASKAGSNKITVTGVLTKKHSFERVGFGYGTETVNIFKITGEDGKVYVWKTTASLNMEVPYTGKEGCHSFENRKGEPIEYMMIKEGDKFSFTASVKGQSEYKGEPQTEIQRVKVTEIILKAVDKEKQKKAERKAKKQEQLDSLKGDDFIWKMPYKQFKEHYADCETVIDSYEEHVDRWGFVQGPPTIEVIIREGRLKESGVRGKHFAGYRIEYTLEGKRYVEPFRAVSERTAINQCMKAHPKATDLEVVEIIFHKGKDWMD